MIRGVNDKESGIQRHDSRLFGADCGDWRQDRIPELECDEGGRGAEDRRTRTRLCNAAEDGLHKSKHFVELCPSDLQAPVYLNPEGFQNRI
jgi:hypothetical protein